MDVIITVLVSVVTGTVSGIAGNAIYDLMGKRRKLK